MKKLATLIMALAFMLINGIIVNASTPILSDVKSTDWFASNVSALIAKGIVNGYTDGTFKPSNPVTKSQFIKMTIVSLGYRDIQASKEYWATPFIKKAMLLQIIPEGSVTPEEFEKPISRGDMAMVIAKGLNESYVSNISDYRSLIKDYDSIQDEYKQYVLKVYTKGIIGGYEDGTFKTANTLTRAEASTVLIRMIDEGKRLYVKTLISDRELSRLQGYPSESGKAATFGQANATLGEQVTDLYIDTAKTYLEKVKFGVNYADLQTDPTEWEMYFTRVYGTEKVTDGGKTYSAEEYQNKLLKEFIDDQTSSSASFLTNSDLVCFPDSNTVAVRGVLKYVYGNSINPSIEKYVQKVSDVEIELKYNSNWEIVVSKMTILDKSK